MILTQICVLCFLRLFKLKSTFAILMISRCPNHLKSYSNAFVLVQANRVLSSDVYDIYLFVRLFVHGRDLLQ